MHDLFYPQVGNFQPALLGNFQPVLTLEYKKVVFSLQVTKQRVKQSPDIQLNIESRRDLVVRTIHLNHLTVMTRGLYLNLEVAQDEALSKITGRVLLPLHLYIPGRVFLSQAYEELQAQADLQPISD